MGSAIRLGSEVLVCGTEIFKNKAGYASRQVLEKMLLQAENELLSERKE